jgi:glycosyltransferase involved in cell wall biosynthesis
VHLIAYRLKRRFNLPWVADFRDPWTEIDFYKTLNLSKFADKKHRKLEKKVLDQADLVVSVGRKMAASFSEKTSTRQLVITNGYDEDDVPLPNQQAKVEKFTLMHVGSVNKDRNHPILWQALKILLSADPSFSNDFELHFIGKLDHQVHTDIEKSGLGKWTRTFSYVPHDEVIQKLQAAAVLYLPLNNSPNADGILTGKVFEYFAAKRPVLAVGPVEGDLGQLLKETQTGTIVGFDELDGMVAALKEMYNKSLQGKLEVDPQGVENYSRRKLTEKLAKELDQLIK